ncbi:623_t:CDS:2 [Ambispora gerdemannii]|uniref:623_t:CDS:1 n=1 Tax=Ambispora gerdemannii TaxID=144530 RepID=A0A9N9C1G6_9GLOM|nr:623_t:CDS:2 [Ambispora gerdemannii]
MSGAEPGILINKKIIIFDSYDLPYVTTAFSLDLSKNWTTVPDQRNAYSSTFKDGKIYYIGDAYRTDEVADIREDFELKIHEKFSDLGISCHRVP